MKIFLKKIKILVEKPKVFGKINGAIEKKVYI
jgi:hypothetical protein